MGRSSAITPSQSASCQNSLPNRHDPPAKTFQVAQVIETCHWHSAWRVVHHGFTRQARAPPGEARGRDRVGAVPDALMRPKAECCCPLRGSRMGLGMGPLAKPGLDEASRLAAGARRDGPGADMADLPSAADARQSLPQRRRRAIAAGWGGVGWSGPASRQCPPRGSGRTHFLWVASDTPTARAASSWYWPASSRRSSSARPC